MEQLEELKAWVKSLNPAEKRFIKLIGKAKAGTGGSQHLDLMDRLNAADDKQDFGKLPYAKNLSMVSVRLRELIVDALRMLRKGEGWDAMLQTDLTDLGIYYNKGWLLAANRLLKRAKDTAQKACRYDVLLQLLQWERRLIQAKPSPDLSLRLEAVSKEEGLVFGKYQTLLRLNDVHDALTANAKRFWRSANSLKILETLDHRLDALLVEASTMQDFLPRVLAVNILGIKALAYGNAPEALGKYQPLLLDWKDSPDWQREKSKLLAAIANNYQLACFSSNLDQETAKAHLDLLYQFTSLPEEGAIQFRRVLFHNQLQLALNTGNFGLVNSTIPKAVEWLSQVGSRMGPIPALVMLGNLAIAEFLQGRWAEANRFVIRIQQVPDPKARPDIRDFARLLQAVLQHELGDHALNEYLTRAGKRHFSKQTRAQAFELAIFKYLEAASKSPGREKHDAALAELSQELEQIAAQIAGQVPLMGLMEMRIWIQCKTRNLPIQEVFLEIVAENLRQLG